MKDCFKRCFKCGVEKFRTEFYAHSKMGDGLLGKCKSCTRNDTANRVSRKQKEVDWVLKEAERCRIKQRPKNKTNKETAEYRNERSEKYKQKYPDKTKARYLVSNALRDGRLIKQPCEICGQIEDVEGHHEDYSKPLDVNWLCVIHHAERHVKINDEKRIQKVLKKQK